MSASGHTDTNDGVLLCVRVSPQEPSKFVAQAASFVKCKVNLLRCRKHLTTSPLLVHFCYQERVKAQYATLFRVKRAKEKRLNLVRVRQCESSPLSFSPCSPCWCKLLICKANWLYNTPRVIYTIFFLLIYYMRQIGDFTSFSKKTPMFFTYFFRLCIISYDFSNPQPFQKIFACFFMQRTHNRPQK